MALLVRLIGSLVLAAMLALAATGSARADQLDSYRASGVIAERFDGFVELRSGGDSAAQAVVDSVNRQRRAIYEKHARAENVPMAEVGKLFAGKIINQAPAGTYFRQPNGQYVRN